MKMWLPNRPLFTHVCGRSLTRYLSLIFTLKMDWTEAHLSRRDIFCQKRNLAYSAQIGFDLLSIGYNGWKQVVENRLMFISYRVYQALAATTCLTVLSVYFLCLAIAYVDIDIWEVSREISCKPWYVLTQLLQAARRSCSDRASPAGRLTLGSHCEICCTMPEW